MARKFKTPITIDELGSASSQALAANVDGDSQNRINIDAGGKITWGSGSATGDTTLYRSTADTLKTDDAFTATSLAVTGQFTFPTSDGSADQVITTNGSGTLTWSDVSANATVSDTAPSSPAAGQIWYESDTGKTFVYYDSFWIEVGASPPASPFITDLDEDTKIQVEESSDEDKIRFDTAGSERMIIDSSGNVGIGTTSPSDLLHIDAGTSGAIKIGTTAGRIAELTANDSEPFLSVGSTTSHSFAIMTNGSRRLTIDSSGNVGINDTTPSYTLDVKGNAQVASGVDTDLFVKTTADSSYTAAVTIGGARTASTQDNVAQLRFHNYSDQSTSGDYEAARISAVDPSGAYASGNGALVFKTSNGGSLSERMRIEENGRLLLKGQTSVPSAVTSAGDADGLFLYAATGAGTARLGMWIDGDGGTGDLPFVVANASSAPKCVIYGDGDIANVNNRYEAYSDASLKQDIVDANPQWDDIKAVQLRNFRLIADVEENGDDALVHLGVVAQELEAAGMTGLVKTVDDQPKRVAASILYMKSIGALQEAMARIETLETTNSDLIARIEALEAE